MQRNLAGAIKVLEKLVEVNAKRARQYYQRMAQYSAEVRLHELAIPTADVIDIAVLKELRLVPAQTSKVKVILSGEIEKAVKLKGIAVTKGARAAIEKAGGSIE